MQEFIIYALENRDYKLATSIIEQLQKERGDDPWLPFYEAKLSEVRENYSLSREQYQNILQTTTNQKIIVAARQGLERVCFKESQLRQKQRESALISAQKEADFKDLGILVFNPMTNEEKSSLLKEYARTIGTDPYTARLHLPSRAPKIYKVGSIAQLRIYAGEFQKIGIPCFCTSLKAIDNLKVYQVEQCIMNENNINIVYKNEPEIPRQISFDWREITQAVEGAVPLFEERLELDHRGKEKRKTKTLDYAHLFDLHLTRHNSIIRICDQTYKYQQLEQTTAWENWTKLISSINKYKKELPRWSEFTPFAESVRDFQTSLASIEPRSSLLRREDSYWDIAYQLYSGLLFLQKI